MVIKVGPNVLLANFVDVKAEPPVVLTSKVTTMDNFKESSYKWVGPGGVKCNCCFAYYGKKEVFRRLTRKHNNITVRSEIESGIDEYFSGDRNEE